jgi:transglutaminase-like putative cysteine protease
MKLALRKPTGPPEDSVAMRVVVACAVQIAIAAVVAQPGAVPAQVASATLVLAPVGYWVSYRRRYASNLLLKIALSVALLAALGQFLSDVRSVTSVDQARIPLASLFLWVQVLHAFDVPRRRDLAFSMVSSLILMAEAGSLSLSTSFGLFLLPWAGFAGAWLSLSARPRADQVTTPVAVRRHAGERRTPRTAPIRSAAAAAGLTLVAASLVFLAMPRLPGTFVRTPPFSLAGNPSPVGAFDGSVSNPGLPADPGDGVVDFSSGGYPGFSDVVDLRARGRLSDDLAFRVRAQQAALWRAQVFDRYDGTTWTITDDRTQPLAPSEDGLSVDVPVDVALRNDALGGGSSRVVQTFYIEAAQPNVLFAAASARQVYFPSAGLRVDDAGSIRSPILLDRGLVYSVISEVPVTNDRMLARASTQVPRGLAPYLQLPAAVPERVAGLAARITAGGTTQHDRVLAVQSWLRANTRYDLDVPRDPEGVDAVDHFVFETRRGYCEQIATSMAVMLRTLGIPARLVTGYGPGDRNPLTGYFEVRQSDAHAWVEVFYPGVGWVPYDPTFGVPEAAPSAASRFMAGPVFAAIGRFVSTVVAPPRNAAAGTAARAVADAGALVLRVWPILLGALFALGFALVAARRVRRRRGAVEAATPMEAAFLGLTDTLEHAGHARAPHTTPSEYLDELGRDSMLAAEVIAAAEIVVRTFERERFALTKPTERDVAEAREACARVRTLVGRR